MWEMASHPIQPVYLTSVQPVYACSVWHIHLVSIDHALLKEIMCNNAKPCCKLFTNYKYFLASYKMIRFINLSCKI
jgi:hypothetical protein